MIRAGRFYARIIVDGYEIYDDTVRAMGYETMRIGPPPIRTVYVRHSSTSQLKREASAEVARLHHEAITAQRLTTAAGNNPPSSS